MPARVFDKPVVELDPENIVERIHRRADVAQKAHHLTGLGKQRRRFYALSVQLNSQIDYGLHQAEQICFEP